MSSERIVLGSGKLYFQKYSGTVPETDALCTEPNLLGLIKGGATLTYTPEFYEAKDDLGLVTKNILTSEEVTLTSGIMTFNGDVLKTLCDTGRVTEDSSKHLRTVKIGGVDNATNDSYVLCFHHSDAQDGDIWVIIVGKNQSGFSIAFATDSETVIDAEFKALPQDNEGTLIKYIEEDSSIGA